MKKILLSLFLFTTCAQAQEKCLSEILFREEAKKNPALQESRDRLEGFTQAWIAKNGATVKRNASATATYIIPVVFHVIHKGGTENISDAQIMDQMSVR